MASNLSVKNVPETTLVALRARAARNHRSLQGELMSILEAAVSGQGSVQGPVQSLGHDQTAPVPGNYRNATESMDKISIEALATRAKQLFPAGTPSSVDLLRAMRDARDSRNG